MNEDPNAQLIRDLRQEIDTLKSKLGEGEVANQEVVYIQHACTRHTYHAREWHVTEWMYAHMHVISAVAVIPSA